MPNTEDRTRKVIAELLGYKTIQVTDEKRLTIDLRADSLDEVELVMDLEDEFTIIINDTDHDKWVTVGDVINTMKKLTATN